MIILLDSTSTMIFLNQLITIPIAVMGIIFLWLVHKIRYKLSELLICLFNPFFWVGMWMLAWFLKRVEMRTRLMN